MNYENLGKENVNTNLETSRDAVQQMQKISHRLGKIPTKSMLQDLSLIKSGRILPDDWFFVPRGFTYTIFLPINRALGFIFFNISLPLNREDV